MRINKFLAIVLAALSSVILSVGSAQAEEQMITVTYTSPAGSSSSVIAAEDILNAFGNAFAQLKDAVREILAELKQGRSVSRTISMSAKVSLGLSAVSAGGGGGCNSGVASCN